MRGETLNWWKQAVADLDTAKANLKIGKFYASAFFSQQAVEKALKSLYLETRRSEPDTHNLMELGTSVDIPARLLHNLRSLNLDYTVARYPDAAGGVPAEMYDKETAEEKLSYARAVLGWTKEQLRIN